MDTCIPRMGCPPFVEQGTRNCCPNLCGSSLSSGGLPQTGTMEVQSQGRRARDKLVMGPPGRQDASTGTGKEEATGLKGEAEIRSSGEADGGTATAFLGLSMRSKSGTEPTAETDLWERALSVAHGGGDRAEKPRSRHSPWASVSPAVTPALLPLPDTLGTSGREMRPWIYPPFPISLLPPPPLPPPCWNQFSSWHFKGQCARFMAVPYKTILHDNTSSPLLGTFGKFIGQTFFCADRWGPAITSASRRGPLLSSPPLFWANLMVRAAHRHPQGTASPVPGQLRSSGVLHPTCSQVGPSPLTGEPPAFSYPLLQTHLLKTH